MPPGALVLSSGPWHISTNSSVEGWAIYFFDAFFLFARSFFNRRSLGFLDRFTGQSPGNGRNELAISVPVALALPGSWPSPRQSSVRRGGFGFGRVGLGPWPRVGSREDHYFTEFFQASPGPQFHASLLAACQRRVHSIRHRATCFP